MKFYKEPMVWLCIVIITLISFMIVMSINNIKKPKNLHNNRFNVTRVSDTILVKDKETGKEYLGVYQFGLIELKGPEAK